MKCPTCDGVGYEDGVPCGNCRRCHRCPGCGDILPDISSYCELCGWSIPDGVTTVSDPSVFLPQVKALSDETTVQTARPSAPPPQNALRGVNERLDKPLDSPLDPSQRLKPKDTKDLDFVMAAGGYSAKQTQKYKISKPRPKEQFSHKYLESDNTKWISATRSYDALFQRCAGGSSMHYGYRLHGDNSWLEPLHSVSSQEMNHPYWPQRAEIPEHLVEDILGRRPNLKVLCDDGIVYDRWQIAYLMLVYNLWLPGAFKYTDAELAKHMTELFFYEKKKTTETQIRRYRRIFNLLNPATPVFRYVRYPFDAPRPSSEYVSEEHRVYICRNYKYIYPVECIYPTRGTGVKYLLEKIPPALRYRRKSKPVPVKHIVPEKIDPQVLTNAIEMAEKEMSDVVPETPIPTQADGVVEGAKQTSAPATKRTRRKARKADTPYSGFNTFPGWQGNR